jgi:hypothetical protein
MLSSERSTHRARPARTRRWAIAAVLVVAAAAPASMQKPRFYDDDPIAREPDPRDASAAQPWKIGLLYDLAYNLGVVSRYVPSGTRAQNVNTIDEVPDSNWFTNRIGTTELTPEQIVQGPLTGRPPNPERWTLVREKSSGVNPGFTAIDANGETWFLAFDADWPEGDSAAIVIANKIFWALGYNQVESYITWVDPKTVTIDPEATARRPNGTRTPYTRDDLKEVLERARRDAKGVYRVAAGRLIPGKILGGFRYVGTRPDDPNDIVPHQHRRELRALRVFGAWTNLTDLKAGNTLDSLVSENGHMVVRHYLQDVGSTFGTANGRHEYDIGWEYFWQHEPSMRRLWTFGFALSPWQTVPYVTYPTIGRFEGDAFDPRAWKPQTPTQAYMELRDDDAFWAARRVAAFTDAQIRAIVHAGQLSDAAAEKHLAEAISKRRDKIAATYLPAVNPVVDPRLDGGVLTFGNAAVDAHVAAAPSGYAAKWFLFDNATGSTTAIADTRGASTSVPAPATLPATAGAIVQVDIAAEAPLNPSWAQAVHVWFRKTASGWKLVGLERLPERIGGPADGATARGTR